MININDLPNEILRHLIQYLSHREVKTLGKTCQRMSLICEESMESRRKAVYIKASWRNGHYNPPLEDILNAASLARRGFLTAVGNIYQRGPCQAKGLAWPSACRRQTTYGHVFLFLIFLSNIPIIGRRYSSLT